MWRTTFFRSATDLPPAGGNKLPGSLLKLGSSLLRPKVRVCRMCHAELEAHEFAEGYCQDRNACCGRVYSQRCW